MKRKKLMFKTNKYKIHFKREEAHIRLFNPIRIEPRDGTWCFFERLDGVVSKEIQGTAKVAFLHSKDTYDKIIGKKVSLTKTMKAMDLSKEERIKIWKAFWEWIESWKKQSYRDKYIIIDGVTFRDKKDI